MGYFREYAGSDHRQTDVRRCTENTRRQTQTDADGRDERVCRNGLLCGLREENVSLPLIYYETKGVFQLLVLPQAEEIDLHIASDNRGSH